MYLYPIMRGTVLTTSVFLTLLLWGIHPAVAQIQTQNVTVNASLNVNTALTLTQETPLYFGAFQAGKGSGTITLTASETPQLSYTGYVTVLSTHGLSAGKFRVSGNPNAKVNIICAAWCHTLYGPDATMNIHYTKNAESITLNSSGIGYVYIGATADTWYNHPSGTYSGTYELSVVYD